MKLSKILIEAGVTPSDFANYKFVHKIVSAD